MQQSFDSHKYSAFFYKNILSSDKYTGVYAEIISDDSSDETGIILHYEPVSKCSHIVDPI